MHERVATLLKHEEDIDWLAGSGPHTVEHYLTCRLFNTLVTREELRLAIEQQDAMSQRK